MNLKPIIRIDKSSLRSILGKMSENRIPYRDIIHRNETACAGCPHALWHDQVVTEIEAERSKETVDIIKLRYLQTQLEAYDTQCKSCPHCWVERKYMNEKSTYQYYKKQYEMKRLPKTAVKLYILLFSIPMEKMGSLHIIRDISIQAISRKLSVNKITVQRSLEILDSFDLIIKSHSSDSDHFNIIIKAYDTMHLTGREGGAGYVTLEAAAMDTILSISNVNALRLELLKLLELDNISRSKEEIDNYIRIPEIKKILPDHLNYQGKYTILHNYPSIFSSSVDGSIINYSLKGSYSIKIDLEKRAMAFEDDIKEALKIHGIQASETDILDITDLTSQYTLKVIINAIKEVSDSYTKKYQPVINLPALIRTISIQINHASIAA